MIKPIKNFENYYGATIDGQIWSYRSNKFIKPYKSKTSKYLMIDLSINSKKYKKLVHRLIAETYINNELNKPEVDHIDNDIYNNNVSNLQWVTRKENLSKSYETMSPIRNFRNCILYKGSEIIKKFDSITECCVYANNNFGISKTSLMKYGECKGYSIIKV